MSALADFLSSSPSEQTLAFVEQLTSKDAYGHRREQLRSLAIAAFCAEELGSDAPALNQIEQVLVKQVLTSKISVHNLQRAPWSSFFLACIGSFGLAEGETDRIVVSPTGMLHARDRQHWKDKQSASKHTSCGKSMNEKWLYRFARGGRTHQLYRFNHKSCSHCMGIGNDPYEGEGKQSREDYAEIWKDAVEQTTLLLRQALVGELGDYVREQMPLDTSIFEKLVAVYAANSKAADYQLTNELNKQGIVWSTSYDLRAALGKIEDATISEPLRRFFASRLAEMILDAPRHQIASFLLTPASSTHSAMPNLAVQAQAAYGSLDELPLPDAETLAGLLYEMGERRDIHTAIESFLLPKLLVSIWIDGLMQVARESFPENGGQLPETLLVAYRIMPGRKPSHTNGTHRLDLAALYQELDEHRSGIGMDWPSAAAEMNLDLAAIEAVAAGQQPDVNTFLTLAAWLRDRSRYSRPLEV